VFRRSTKVGQAKETSTSSHYSADKHPQTPVTSTDESCSQDETNVVYETEYHGCETKIPSILITGQSQSNGNKGGTIQFCNSHPPFASTLNNNNLNKATEEETKLDINQASQDSDWKTPPLFASFIESILIQDFLDDEY
jgi:hypothetical protein